jgi:hypothetical protein
MTINYLNCNIVLRSKIKLLKLNKPNNRLFFLQHINSLNKNNKILF